ncbi:transmembrane protein 51 [Arapaima gigas]
MCYSDQPPPSPSPTEGGNSSGSQYALCALGVGLVSLGVVMIVWSVVPLEFGSTAHDKKGATSSVAFIIVAAGIAMLMLSMCLAVHNKRRQARRENQLPDTSMQDRNSAREQGVAATATDQAARYDVPSYEEVVGSGQYPIPQSTLPNSNSQLPSYDDLMESRPDVGPAVDAGSENFVATFTEATDPAEPEFHSGHTVHQLQPLRVRRIQSEKLHLEEHSALAGLPNIEPLTPPPRYEDMLPEL